MDCLSRNAALIVTVKPSDGLGEMIQGQTPEKTRTQTSKSGRLVDCRVTARTLRGKDQAMDHQQVEQRLSQIATVWTVLLQGNKGAGDADHLAQAAVLERYQSAV